MTERPRIIVRDDGGMVVVGDPGVVVAVEVPAWAVEAIRAYREPSEAEITAAIESLDARTCRFHPEGCPPGMRAAITAWVARGRTPAPYPWRGPR